jgi:hypothetical protein
MAKEHYRYEMSMLLHHQVSAKDIKIKWKLHSMYSVTITEGLIDRYFVAKFWVQPDL